MFKTKDEIKDEILITKYNLSKLEKQLLQCDTLDIIRDTYHVSTGKLMKVLHSRHSNSERQAYDIHIEKQDGYIFTFEGLTRIFTKLNLGVLGIELTRDDILVITVV